MWLIWMAEQNKGANPFTPAAAFGDSRKVTVSRVDTRKVEVARTDSLSVTVAQGDNVQSIV